MTEMSTGMDGPFTSGQHSDGADSDKRTILQYIHPRIWHLPTSSSSREARLSSLEPRLLSRDTHYSILWYISRCQASGPNSSHSSRTELFAISWPWRATVESSIQAKNTPIACPTGIPFEETAEPPTDTCPSVFYEPACRGYKTAGQSRAQ